MRRTSRLLMGRLNQDCAGEEGADPGHRGPSRHSKGMRGTGGGAKGREVQLPGLSAHITCHSHLQLCMSKGLFRTGLMPRVLGHCRVLSRSNAAGRARARDPVSPVGRVRATPSVRWGGCARPHQSGGAGARDPISPAGRVRATPSGWDWIPSPRRVREPSP